MKGFMVVCAIAVISFASCSRGIDEGTAKQQIREWWQVDGIEEVVVESFRKTGKTSICNARLVVSNDTLGRMTYEFHRGVGGWELTRGPFDDRRRQFLLDMVGLVNIDFFQSQLELLEMFAGVMDVYGSYGGGRYPLTLSTKLEAIPGYHGDKGEESVLSMMQPFLEGALPFIEAMGDTNEWFDEYRGKIVYFPLQKEDGYALQFTVRAAMDTCFTNDIMHKWRESQESGN
jgi:hypothetical protein